MGNLARSFLLLGYLDKLSGGSQRRQPVVLGAAIIKVKDAIRRDVGVILVKGPVLIAGLGDIGN